MSVYDVLGIPIEETDLDNSVSIAINRMLRGEPALITARDVHGVMLAQSDQRLLDIHRRAAMNLPDGNPIAIYGRLIGKKVSRVPGPDFMLQTCAKGVAYGVRHYFFGGKDGVADAVARELKAMFPGLIVAGVATPAVNLDPSRFDEAAVNNINAAAPHVVWVGLSTPKQELWMDRHLSVLNGATVAGVGAAFDIHAGLATRAPIKMQKLGLEWLYRFYNEPRRLWKRYLVLAPRFVILLVITSFKQTKNNARP